MSASLNPATGSAGARASSLAWRAAMSAGRALALLRGWLARNHAHQLDGLSDHMLRDIGLSRIDVDGRSMNSCWWP